MDVVCVGEGLIDFVSAAPVVSVADAPAFVPAAGGSVLNTSVALARLGAATGFVGKVGDDPFGRLLGRVLADNGVDTSGLLFDTDARTALAFVALDEVGHPDFVFFRHPSADMRLRKEEIDPAYVASGRILHTGSVIFGADPGRSAAIEAMRLARAAGSLVSLDPNVRVSVYESREELRRVILGLVPLVDVLKLSEEDLAELLGSGDAESGSAALLARGVRLVVVTRGKDGCFARNARGTLAVPGYVVPVVDTTGSGDAFVGGLLAGILARGLTAEELAGLDADGLRPLLRLANGAGALTATVRGAVPGLPTRAALRSFMVQAGEAASAELLSA